MSSGGSFFSVSVAGAASGSLVGSVFPPPPAKRIPEILNVLPLTKSAILRKPPFSFFKAVGLVREKCNECAVKTYLLYEIILMETELYVFGFYYIFTFCLQSSVGLGTESIPILQYLYHYLYSSSDIAVLVSFLQHHSKSGISFFLHHMLREYPNSHVICFMPLIQTISLLPVSEVLVLTELVLVLNSSQP